MVINFYQVLTPLFKASFFIPLFGNGSKKFQPVLIDDIVKFVFNVISDFKLKSRLFELAGPEVFTYSKFYALIAKTMGKKRVLYPFSYTIA